MGLFDILLIGVAGAGAAYFFNIAGFKDLVDGILDTTHGDPGCMFDDNCRAGMPGYGTPVCYPCGYPA